MPSASTTRSTYSRFPLDADSQRAEPLHQRRVVSDPPAVTGPERRRFAELKDQDLPIGVPPDQYREEPSASRAEGTPGGLSKAEFLEMQTVEENPRIQRGLGGATVRGEEAEEATSHGDAFVTEIELDKQTRILRAVFHEFGIRSLLVTPSDMDALVRSVVATH